MQSYSALLCLLRLFLFIKNISILRVAIGAKDTHTAQTTISVVFVSEQVPCFVALFFCASVGFALREFFSFGHAFRCSECGLETERGRKL